ncbi:uncharacterized protein [Oscarella lobularis]|uniref:uncharacterized protein n=1 Tax=Oscarella lobularis TaxID=121494 RepID=UPI003314084D
MVKLPPSPPSSLVIPMAESTPSFSRSRSHSDGDDAYVDLEEHGTVSLVSNVEIHFVFSFSIPGVVESFEPENVDKWESFEREYVDDPVKGAKLERLERLFGNDGHSQFGDVVKTFEHKIFGSQEIKLKSVTLDLPEKEYKLNQVFIRLFKFHVGLLRFAITACDKVSIQHVLNVQNGVMRLKEPKKEKIRLVYASSKEEFDPNKFIKECLGSDKVTDDRGVERTKYAKDAKTDRLMVFTLAEISGLSDRAQQKAAAYKMATMEWETGDTVKADVLDDFYTNNVFKKFILKKGGLWSCFHRDSGSIFVFEKDLSSFPFFGYSRAFDSWAGKNVFGSSWPFVALSLIEVVAFMRTFLRNIDKDLRERVKTTGRDESKANLKQIKKLHAELLRFRAHYHGSEMSSTAGGCKQFEMWSELSGIAKLMNGLREIVQDVDAYYDNVRRDKSQFTLDILTVVLGFLGVAELFSEIYWTYQNTEMIGGSERDSNNAVVPSLFTIILTILGILFIYKTQ